MYNHDDSNHTVFYSNTVDTVNRTFDIPDDLCFVYVQHAFTPLVKHFNCIRDRLAAVIPKASSANANPEVLSNLEKQFPGRILSNITRHHLCDINYTLQLLKDTTRGRPFAILEYGGYFAPAAKAIASDRYLGPRLAGFVEGTENGIRGSDDGLTIGYQKVAQTVARPIVSKSRSGIKKIMDLQIGPAIVQASDEIHHRYEGCRLQQLRGRFGVVGLGAIGRGVLHTLFNHNINPMVFDSNLSVLAEMANRQHHVVSQDAILSRSDVLYLNTGSCFLSQKPSLLRLLKDNVLLILCTSGDVEAGIPQLLAANEISLGAKDSSDGIAVYHTRDGKRIRVMLGKDSVGQAPNISVADGSGSTANLMSDMEFYAIGAYLGSRHNTLPAHQVSQPPASIENLIFKQWLNVFHPACLETHPTAYSTAYPSTLNAPKQVNQMSLNCVV
jgi:hypothetical protein